MKASAPLKKKTAMRLFLGERSFQAGDPVALKSRLYRLRKLQSPLVVCTRFCRLIHGGVDATEQRIGSYRVGCKGQGLLRLGKRFWQLIRREQFLRLVRMAERCRQRNLKMTVEHEHSEIDHRGRLERFKLLVRIQHPRTEFPAG